MKLQTVFLLLLTTAIAFTSAPATAQHAFVFYSDGIEGEAVVKGAEGASEVLGYLHETSMPIDLETGRITGSPVHSPIRVIKPIDKATPLLMQANLTGQVIQQLRFEFWRITPTGASEVYYTVTIEDVRLTRINTFLANPDELGAVTMPETPLLGNVALETVSAIYGRIKWQHVDGIEYEDTWTEAPSGKSTESIPSSDIAATVFPNPFSAAATLSVDLDAMSSAGDVEVSIYDALGRRVSSEVLQGATSTKRYVWDATDMAGRAVPSGLYFYRVRAGDAVATGGMTLVK